MNNELITVRINKNNTILTDIRNKFKGQLNNSEIFHLAINYSLTQCLVTERQIELMGESYIKGEISSDILKYWIKNTPNDPDFLFSNPMLEEVKNKTADFEKKAVDRITFRWKEDPDPLLQINELIDMYCVKTKTDAIKCCLAYLWLTIKEYGNNEKTTTQKTSPSSPPLLLEENICYRAGIKSIDILPEIIRQISWIQQHKNILTYIEPFTGTANVLLHLHVERFDNIIINDHDENMINLLKILRNNITKFIKQLYSYPIDSMFYKELKAYIDELSNIELKNPNLQTRINRAVGYYYLLLLSSHGKGDSLTSSSPQTLWNKFPILLKVSEGLKKVNIIKNDAFYLLNKISKGKYGELDKILIYLDPPYIDTEYYYEKGSKKENEKKHKREREKLSRKLIELKENGVKILLSYRATLRAGSLDKFKRQNDYVQDTLDSLYLNHGFYILFIRLYKKKKERIAMPFDQIEILISSEPFEYNRIQNRVAKKRYKPSKHEKNCKSCKKIPQHRIHKSFPYNRSIKDLIKLAYPPTD